MRRIRTSKTFDLQLADLLDFGSQHYADNLIEAKRRLVYRCLHGIIAMFPEAKRPHPQLGLVAYPISKTPFVVLYDFDDAEVRVHFIVHRRADLDALDGAQVDW